MIEKQQPAVDFCMPSATGSEICLKDLRGKWVVLFFYVKDNTSGCTSEALEFSEHLHEFEAAGAVVFGVSPDSVESHRKFQEKHALKLTLLSDPEHRVLEAYGAWGPKKMYGKEYFGVIRSSVLIDPAGNVAHVWPGAKSKGHAAEVLAKLRELTA
ncbi:MAG: peroxiredoxin [Deltaproteobacteria bacterium]|nr:peroxiredoxin [Deltaproteobacteria bacterium]